MTLSTTFADVVTSFRHRYTCLSSAGQPTFSWNFSRRESLGCLKLHPVQNFSSHIIAVMKFQGTPLAGGLATTDNCVGGLEGCGVGSPAGGRLVGVFDTRLSVVVYGGALGITKACCRVSLLYKRFLSSRRSRFTSTTSPTRKRLFTPG